MQGNLKDSVLRPEILKRILIYSLLTLFLGCIQCAFFPLLDFCPQTPDLVLVMLVAIALLDGPTAAMICSVGAGFFVDAIGASGFAFAPLIYFLTVALVSLFTGKILKSFPSYILLLVPTLLCRATATLICLLVTGGAIPLFTATKLILLPEMVCTALSAVPIYFLVKLCCMPLRSHGKFTF